METPTRSKKSFRECPECKKRVWGRFSKGIFICSEMNHYHVVPIKVNKKEKHIDDIQDMLFI